MAAFASPGWATATISLGVAPPSFRPWCNGERNLRSAALSSAQRRRRVVPIGISEATSSHNADLASTLPPTSVPPTVAARASKTYWIQPLSSEVATAVLEASSFTLVFGSAEEAAPYRRLARFAALLLSPEGLGDAGVYRLKADDGAVTGAADGVSAAGDRLWVHLGRIDTPERQTEAMSLAGREPLVVGRPCRGGGGRGPAARRRHVGSKGGRRRPGVRGYGLAAACGRGPARGQRLPSALPRAL